MQNNKISDSNPNLGFNLKKIKLNQFKGLIILLLAINSSNNNTTNDTIESSEGLDCCSYIIIGLSFVLYVLTLPLSIFMSLKVQIYFYFELTIFLINK